MSDRFTEYAKDALENALKISNELGSGYVGTEHLLLGVLQGQGTGSKILTECGADYRLLYAIAQQRGVQTSGVEATAKDTSPRLREALLQGAALCEKYGSDAIGTEHLLLAIAEEEEGGGSRLLKLAGLSVSALKDELRSYMLVDSKVSGMIVSSQKKSRYPSLEKYGRDLCAVARQGLLDPVIGREAESERLLQILCRKNKNNPCLVGDPGVGKTAVVEGVAHLIAQNRVPDLLKNKTIFSLDLSALIAGARYRGEFEERLRSVINEAKNSDVILFVDEIHTLVGAGAAEGAVDGANILKPPLSRGEIRLIGATTFTEYKKYIERDSALERRFAKIYVNEPDRESTLTILRGIKERYEQYHGITIEDDALVASVDLSIRYLPERFLPDKAIDLLDESSSRLKVEQGTGEGKKGVLDRENIAKTLALQVAGVVLDGKEEKEEDLKQYLLDASEGQKEASERLALSIKGLRAGLKDEEGPLGCYLFVGGEEWRKRALAKGVAKLVFHSDRALISIDLSEYTESHSISSLIGAPPGYVGYEEGGKLTERVRRAPHSLLLFEKAEKAHPDVLGLLSQILEKGRLEDASGRSVDFKGCLLIFSLEMPTVSRPIRMPGTDGAREQESRARSLLERQISASIVNRADEIILFEPSSDRSIAQLAYAQARSIERQANREGYRLRITDRYLDAFLKEQKRRGEKDGARIKRELLKSIRALLAERTTDVKGNAGLVVDTEGEVAIIRRDDA